MKRFFWAILLFGPATGRAADLESWDDKIDTWFTPIVEKLNAVLFWSPFGEAGLFGQDVPLILIWLFFGAIFFTLFLRFIGFRHFKHAFVLLAGRYDDRNAPGQISYFAALCTALSGTVGLGNIAGVAFAITIGGPGATVWMILAGLLGMATKYSECLLGVKYRNIDANGKVHGGPMQYIQKGFSAHGMAFFGKFLAIVFCLMCVGGSLGGGNMFQANQSFQLISDALPIFQDSGAVYGIFLALLVGVVIIGGVRSIARVTSWVVPVMFLVYIVSSLYIIFTHLDHLGVAFKIMFEGAFGGDALKGGIIGVMVVGIQRAAFSNEAGIGSSSIVHSAARTKEPAAEGTVAMLEPFMDTVIICTMTALVIIFTGYAEDPQGLNGTLLTSAAFNHKLPGFDVVLLLAVFFFSFSTLLAWSYYGLQAWNYMFGKYGGKAPVELSYKLLFLSCIVIGAASNFKSVLDFSDIMLLSMAFPNILAMLFLCGEIRRETRSYYSRLAAGEIVPSKVWGSDRV